MQPADAIGARIRTIRGQRVLLGGDLAALYGARTKALTQAVRRNAGRFPREFAFPLTKQEFADLRSQIVTSNRGGIRTAPLAFTEHGALMAATVLHPARAIEVSVHIVRAFVQMRESLASSRQIGKRPDDLESKVGTHDRAIAGILGALRQLTAPSEPPKRRRIGFV